MEANQTCSCGKKATFFVVATLTSYCRHCLPDRLRLFIEKNTSLFNK